MSQINCNRVAWNEGMLIEVQHFQQLERSLEHRAANRFAQTLNHGWGFTHYEIDHEALGLNRFGLRRARGTFPDGTAFSIPEGDPLPEYVDLQRAVPGDVICLAVPMAHLGTGEVEYDGRTHGARYFAILTEVADANVARLSGVTAQRVNMPLGMLNSRLCLESQLRSNETFLRLARVRGRQSASSVLLDEHFIPALLDSRAHPSLKALCAEFQSVLSLRLGSRIQGTVLSAGGSVAELIELLMAQALAEYRLRLRHLDAFSPLPPSSLFVELMGLLGRLAIVPGLEDVADRTDLAYDHDNLQVSFQALSQALRRALALIIETPLLSLPFENQGDGFYRCVIDRQWRLQKLVFAFRAEMPSETLRVQLPQQIKLGPVETIQKLVDLQLPGARLMPVPVTPRHVPFYAQSVYFEVESTDSFWESTVNSAAMALRVVGDFPGLQFEAWGLREGKVA
ncbi:type VI secretion system baseplate subunit TssK [Paraburkholderia susongensis]|uniref:Type VI secretion system protein ImpJ n=1 Tax=Paraburkholderia susongensis TaxID=1515439 RepID=A0A1X7M559_9BURK|nr:type VI secretion system baseplate subunit TssK [Paraburkholderia susongensis]SMG61110.1 type VI secretion system protein ImpJ [Paraburkholderia susongensis]